MKINRNKFKAWLEDQPTDKTAGYRTRETSCPLARFTSAGITEDRIIHDNEEQPLPLWARTFVEDVDNSGSAKPGGRITVGRCLSILAAIR